VGGPNTRITKFKMADGPHLRRIEKSPYNGNGLTDRHEILRTDAVWPVLPYIDR